MKCCRMCWLNWLNTAVHPSSGEEEIRAVGKRKDIADSFAALFIKVRYVRHRRVVRNGTRNRFQQCRQAASGLTQSYTPSGVKNIAFGACFQPWNMSLRPYPSSIPPQTPDSPTWTQSAAQESHCDYCGRRSDCVPERCASHRTIAPDRADVGAMRPYAPSR